MTRSRAGKVLLITAVSLAASHARPAASCAASAAGAAVSAASPAVSFARPKSLSRNPMRTTIRPPGAGRKREARPGIDSGAAVVVRDVVTRPDLTARPRCAIHSA